MAEAGRKAKRKRRPSWPSFALWRKLKPFGGIRSDIEGRLPCYADDWRQGMRCGIRIFAPSTYIFFASAIPALAFGQQISPETGGIVTTVQILTATAATGILQSVIGGQPLLIVGVSEPIVLIYGYAYTYARDRAGLGADLFLAWMAWACVWAGLMLLLLGVLNACRYTDRFTRFSGELFGMLIAVLFLQQAIKGTLGEFRVDKAPYSATSPAADQFQWRLCNGLWALFIGFGTVITALKIQEARRWRFFTSSIRGFLADYGVTLAVVFWSCLSYALQGAPPGVPRRLALPNTWDVKTTWKVAARMGDVSGAYVGGALIPALLIAILFYFDHTVSSQMAQLDEFNLDKPPAYHYDLFLLGWMTLLCGLIGIPPVNGVLPQAPLHTKSLITLKQQRALGTMRRVAREQHSTRAELLVAMTAACERAGLHRAAGVLTGSPSLEDVRAGEEPMQPEDVAVLIDKRIAPILPLEAQEQRMSNLIQSLLVAACLGITPGIKKMPSSVLWGYFAYLGITSLPGSQFWERFLLLFVETPRRPPKYPGQADAPWMGKVSWRVMFALTAFQAVYCGAVYGITWIPIAGVVFPVPILLLIPAREFLLPRIFGRRDLAALDPAPFEDGEGQPVGRAAPPAVPGRVAAAAAESEDAVGEADKATAASRSKSSGV